MSNPDKIRQDIERTRANLSDDVNALADQANPRTIAEDKVDQAKQSVQSAVHGAKEKVFGSEDDFTDDGLAGQARGLADQVRGGVAGGAGQAQYSAQMRANLARGGVSDAPAAMRRRTRGNPLAAGLVAFGLGALIGGALPATRAEKRYVEQAKDQAQPYLDQARDVAQDTVAGLKQPATEAAQGLKETAQQAASTVQEEASVAKQDVVETAQSGKQNLQDQAKQAQKRVK
ncbi:DUF3618 domain-containing protein [Luteococcus sp. Sow4_B9]|uniref:DUF3618 domain-containing protein n=1 Tax=Luteococcus sp. Sow4_B9 TaxID=3438792 RepID=UPI003F979359